MLWCEIKLLVMRLRKCRNVDLFEFENILEEKTKSFPIKMCVCFETGLVIDPFDSLRIRKEVYFWCVCCSFSTYSAGSDGSMCAFYLQHECYWDFIIETCSVRFENEMMMKSYTISVFGEYYKIGKHVANGLVIRLSFSTKIDQKIIQMNQRTNHQPNMFIALNITQMVSMASMRSIWFISS